MWGGWGGVNLFLWRDVPLFWFCSGVYGSCSWFYGSCSSFLDRRWSILIQIKFLCHLCVCHPSIPHISPPPPHPPPPPPPPSPPPPSPPPSPSSSLYLSLLVSLSASHSRVTMLTLRWIHSYFTSLTVLFFLNYISLNFTDHMIIPV